VSGDEGSAICIAVAAAALASILPIMVGAVADGMGHGVERAGYVASANMAGSLVGSFTGALTKGKFPLGRTLRAALVALLALNLVTCLVEDYHALVSIRFIAGLADGAIISICFLLFGRAVHPGRVLAVYAAGQLLFGIAGLGVIPTMVDEWGWRTLFFLLALMLCPAFLLVGRATQAVARPIETGTTIMAMGPRASLALAAIVLLFTGLASVWAVLEQIGRRAGLSTPAIAAALSGSAAAGFAGSSLIALAAGRKASPWVVIILAPLLIGSIVILQGSPGPVFFVLACAMLNFGWAAGYPVQFDILSRSDKAGSLSTLTPVATGLGLTIGPAVGGALLASAGLDSLAVAASVLVAAGVVISFMAAWHPDR
jgi:predicted MFS family arabinose efflux permease